MIKKQTTREKVKKIYEDKKYWTPAKPPSIRFIAKKLKLSSTAVYSHLKRLSPVLPVKD